MGVDPQKGPGRPWHHQSKDEELKSSENQRPQKHAPLGPEGSASQTCPQTGCFLFSSTLGGPGLSLAAAP